MLIHQLNDQILIGCNIIRYRRHYLEKRLLDLNIYKFSILNISNLNKLYLNTVNHHNNYLQKRNNVKITVLPDCRMGVKVICYKYFLTRLKLYEISR